MWVNLENDVAMSDDDMFKLVLKEAKRINDITKEPIMNIVKKIYKEDVSKEFTQIQEG